MHRKRSPADLRIHKKQSHPARHPIIFLPASGRLDRLSPLQLLIVQSIFRPPRRYQSLFESAASQFYTRLYASESARHLIIARAAPLSAPVSLRASRLASNTREGAGGKNRRPLPEPPEWCLTSRDYRPSHRLAPKSLKTIAHSGLISI